MDQVRHVIRRMLTEDEKPYTLTPSQREPGMHEFDYGPGKVWGVLSVSTDNVAIYEWASQEPGKGWTVKALKALRSDFQRIEVYGIGGYPEEASYKYWASMFDKGLVDRIEDDDGRAVKSRTV